MMTAQKQNQREGRPEQPDAGFEEASKEYREKSNRAEERFAEKAKKIFSGDTLVKAGLMEALDLIPILGTPYTISDAYGAVDGLLDITSAIINRDLDTMKRIEAGVKGASKIAIAAVPYLPASGIIPVLDALLPTQRNAPEPREKK